jgi:hypothetical protein
MRHAHRRRRRKVPIAQEDLRMHGRTIGRRHRGFEHDYAPVGAEAGMTAIGLGRSGAARKALDRQRARCDIEDIHVAVRIDVRGHQPGK